MRFYVAGIAALIVLAAAAAARAQPAPPPILVALAPADDARQAIAIGPSGEVYEPDGAGAWLRTQRIATATTLAVVGRAGGAVVANGGGVVYRLARNGWSAIRLAQHGAAVMSGGIGAVGAINRQLYSLDRLQGGEPAKLALAPAPVLAIGGGKAIVVATERGLYRVDGGSVVPLAHAPKHVARLVSERWALVATGNSGAVDLRTGKTTSWPDGATIEVVAPGPDDQLVAVATIGGALELLTLRGTKLERAPIGAGATGTAVGVVVDRGGRVVVAFADGRLVVRDGTSHWTLRTVGDAVPKGRAGPGPSASK